jgi:hypothetical protein
MLRDELEALRKAYDQLRAWCVERDIHVNQCRSNLNGPHTIR